MALTDAHFARLTDAMHAAGLRDLLAAWVAAGADDAALLAGLRRDAGLAGACTLADVRAALGRVIDQAGAVLAALDTAAARRRRAALLGTPLPPDWLARAGLDPAQFDPRVVAFVGACLAARRPDTQC